MQAFVNGDEDSAIACWIRAAEIAAKSDAEPDSKLAELYYCLGKALADRRSDTDAIEYLRAAVEILSNLNDTEQQLKVAQFALAEVLNRNGGQAEAEAQFRKAYDLPEPDSFETIPLKEAIKQLNKFKLCKELKGGVLSKICNELGLDPDGDNQSIGEILVSYYIDEDRGEKRKLEDKFFVEDYTNFDPEQVLENLGVLSGSKALLVLENQVGDTRDGEYVDFTFKRNDGEAVYRTCSSIVGIVDEYNDQLASFDKKGRFCSLDVNSCFAAYFIDAATQNKLHNLHALVFDQIYGE